MSAGAQTATNSNLYGVLDSSSMPLFRARAKARVIAMAYQVFATRDDC